jgi:hypothetical protein
MKALAGIAAALIVLSAAVASSAEPPCSLPQDEAPTALATAPALPKIESKACPFECCQFGRWKAEKTMPLFDTWKSGRKQIGSLRAGESVNGIDGVHVTYSPDVIRIKSNMPALGLKAGDRVLRYMYLGEGAAQFWFNGKFYPSLELTAEGTGNQSGDCSGQCDGVIVTRGRKEWWVQVRRKDGTTGWTLGDNPFSGMDACG